MASEKHPLVEVHTFEAGCEDFPGGQSVPDVQIESHAPGPTLYAQRWYILILFAMVGFLQNGVWNTWGPLAESSNLAFGWTNGDIALLSNWGPITFLISSPFFAWLMDVKGLRVAALVTSTLVAGGTGLRCITSTNPAATWLIHAGHILNGFAGPVAMGGAPLLSAVWFPAYQRTTATASVAILTGFGFAVSFIIGPLMTPNRSISPGNTSASLQENHHGILEIKRDIMKLMYLEFGAAVITFLLILIYFPKKPPKPPSITAAIERVDFKDGARQLLRHKSFWTLAMPYAISSGVYSAWGSVLDIILKPLGIAEAEAGWIGFYSTVAGNMACLVMAGLADIFKKRMKLYMLVLFSGAAGAFIVLTGACHWHLPQSEVSGLLYPSLVFGAIFINATMPMFFELCCEMTYPIAEGVTSSLLTWLNNVAAFFFLLILMIPNIGTAWMNWCMTISVVFCIPILFMVKERYARLDIESQHVPLRITDKQD